MEREAKRAAKVEHKVNILLGGLQQRDTAARAKIVELAEQLQSAQIELTCFKVWGQTGGAAGGMVPRPTEPRYPGKLFAGSAARVCLLARIDQHWPGGGAESDDVRVRPLCMRAGSERARAAGGT